MKSVILSNNGALAKVTGLWINKAIAEYVSTADATVKNYWIGECARTEMLPVRYTLSRHFMNKLHTASLTSVQSGINISRQSIFTTNIWKSSIYRLLVVLAVHVHYTRTHVYSTESTLWGHCKSVMPSLRDEHVRRRLRLRYDIGRTHGGYR